jgi:invasion protein IalB
MRNSSFIASLSAAAIVFAATQASAQQQQQPSTAAKEKQGQAEQKKICRWLPVTGSNRQERHCLTAEDWKKAEALSW